jgi:hypothetical protein
MRAAHVIPFTPDLFLEYDRLCTEHEALIAHIQQVVPGMRDARDTASMLALEQQDAELRQRIAFLSEQIRRHA